jgi:hypothetical protein
MILILKSAGVQSDYLGFLKPRRLLPRSEDFSEKKNFVELQ